MPLFHCPTENQNIGVEASIILTALLVFAVVVPVSSRRYQKGQLILTALLVCAAVP